MSTSRHRRGLAVGAISALALLAAAFTDGLPCGAPDPAALRAPVQSQEVWAAGVTYLRSKSARMAESKDAGGGTFYDRVYEADRPELFFKSAPQRVVGPGGVTPGGACVGRAAAW